MLKIARSDHELLSHVTQWVNKRIFYFKHFRPFILICSYLWVSLQNVQAVEQNVSLSPIICKAKNIEKIYSESLELFIEKKFSGSLKLLEQRIHCNPTSAKLYLAIGRAYHELGKKQEAIRAYTRTIEIAPRLYQAYGNRGLVFASLGELDKALSDFDKAIKLEPQNYITYSNRAIAYAAKGRVSDAISDLNRALTLNKNYGEAYINRGILFEVTGNIQSACLDWRSALELKQVVAKGWITAQCEGNR